MNNTITKKILIIGGGGCAIAIAERFLAEKIEVIITSVEKEIKPHLNGEDITVITESQILSCVGGVGNFQVLIKDYAGGKSLTVSEIIIAEDSYRTANFSDYGLNETSSVISLSSILKEPNFISEQHNKIIFLLGLKQESNPIVTEEIMLSALRIQQEKRRKLYILTKNLKVAGDGLEALYQKTREAGVIYVKFTDTMPQIIQTIIQKVIQTQSGETTIEFIDEISNQKFRITPDIVVSDETILPSKNLLNISKVLGLDRDPSGFIQSDNVHRLPVFTNRKGVFAAGFSRKIAAEEDLRKDIGSVILAVLNPYEPYEIEKAKAQINSNNCIYCLTCYRLCRHKAVILKPRPEIIDQACEGCGLCTAECPRCAISLNSAANIKPSNNITPLITAFCCSRSAFQAFQSASQKGVKFPSELQIIEVPCAGSISIQNIYSAFKNGAKGVMILACHEENCYSESGNTNAKQRTAYIADFLDNIGVGKDKIIFTTIASNMGNAFVEQINDFIKTLA